MVEHYEMSLSETADQIAHRLIEWLEEIDCPRINLLLTETVKGDVVDNLATPQELGDITYYMLMTLADFSIDYSERYSARFLNKFLELFPKMEDVVRPYKTSRLMMVYLVRRAIPEAVFERQVEEHE